MSQILKEQLQLRADAERYRWLRNVANSSRIVPRIVFHGEELTGADCDSAIDQARAGGCIIMHCKVENDT